MLDKSDQSFSPPPVIGQGWIVTFSDLMSLILAFFVMLFSMSARDPSKVDSAVSSMTEKFAKSSVLSEFGTVASQSGVVVLDQKYLDSVITKIRGHDRLGEVKLLRNDGGTLMVRLVRDRVFVPRTGVLSPEGVALAQDIASSMLRHSIGAEYPNIEVRIIATPQEYASALSPADNETPVILRQAGRFAQTLIDAQISPQAISAVVIEGEAPMIDIAFYTLSEPGKNPAANSKAP